MRTTIRCASASTHSNRTLSGLLIRRSVNRSVDPVRRHRTSATNRRPKHLIERLANENLSHRAVAAAHGAGDQAHVRRLNVSIILARGVFHFRREILTSPLHFAEDKSKDYEIHKSENSVQKKRHYRTNKEDSSRSVSPEKLKDRRNDRSFNRRSNSRTRRNSRNRNRSRNRSRSPRRDNRDR